MRINSQDQTIKKNYIQKYRFLIGEYEEVKRGGHPRYRYVQDFYRAHDLDRRTFGKYYNRYLQSGDEEDLLPRKRGPRWKTRRIVPQIEEKIIELRHKGMNRYEIVTVLRGDLGENTPSPSGVYQVLRRHGLNRLRDRMREEKDNQTQGGRVGTCRHTSLVQGFSGGRPQEEIFGELGGFMYPDRLGGDGGRYSIAHRDVCGLENNEHPEGELRHPVSRDPYG